MSMPIVVLVLIAVWLMPVALVVCLCHSAATGDRALQRQTAARARLGAASRRRRFTRHAARAL
jgi:hypothetical protein